MIQSSKVDSQLGFECFNANLLNDIGQIFHRCSGPVNVCGRTVQVSNIDIFHLLELGLEEKAITEP